jgi:transposase-like protein
MSIGNSFRSVTDDSDERLAQRNGYRDRNLETRAGAVNLRTTRFSRTPSTEKL